MTQSQSQSSPENAPVGHGDQYDPREPDQRATEDAALKEDIHDDLEGPSSASPSSSDQSAGHSSGESSGTIDGPIVGQEPAPQTDADSPEESGTDAAARDI